jgi:hypothetical protein
LLNRLGLFPPARFALFMNTPILGAGYGSIRTVFDAFRPRKAA